LIAPLHSRLSHIEFAIEKTEKPKMAATFFKRVVKILDAENVEHDPKVVAEMVNMYFPDFRRVLGELQNAAATGKIDASVLADVKGESIDQLFKHLKAKEFEDMRKWCANNADQDANELYRKIYDAAPSKVLLKSMPGFIVTLNRGQVQHSQVADPEINMVATLIEIMFETSFA
jgi:DNA polymerase III delta prime subunit